MNTILELEAKYNNLKGRKEYLEAAIKENTVSLRLAKKEALVQKT